MSDNENTSNWSEREIGALWKQTSGKGTKYLSGHVKSTGAAEASDQVRVVVFANKDKTNTKAPDFRMYLSQQGEASEVASSSATGSSDTATEIDDVLE